MIPVRPFQRGNMLRYGTYFLSRLTPHPWIRQVVAGFIGAFVRLVHGTEIGAPSQEAQIALKALSEDGIATVVCPLSPAQIDDILAHLSRTPATRGSQGAPVTADSQGVSTAVYDAPTILACPHLLAAMNHPDMLRIAAGFLGCKPTLSGVGLRWSFASDEAAIDVQRFHRDVEDWKILRLFIYLTDVSADSGPHQFVRGSHRSVGRWRLRPYTDEQIDRLFGRDKVVTVGGARGTAFMGNMWGVHRGVPPTGRPRLLFNCTYAMTETAIYAYQPVPVADSERYDRYINRLLIS